MKAHINCFCSCIVCCDMICWHLQFERPFPFYNDEMMRISLGKPFWFPGSVFIGEYWRHVKKQISNLRFRNVEFSMWMYLVMQMSLELFYRQWSTLLNRYEFFQNGGQPIFVLYDFGKITRLLFSVSKSTSVLQIWFIFEQIRLCNRK